MSKLPRLLPLIAIAIGGVVAVRAAGVAPELFQGATAWAQEAVTAETPGEGGTAAAIPLTTGRMGRKGQHIAIRVEGPVNPEVAARLGVNV